MNTRHISLAHTLQKELMEILVRHLHEHKFGLMTITEVVVTKKLEEARIFVTSSNHTLEAVNYLNRNKPTFLKHLKQLLLIRKIPKITFVYDTRPEYAARIELLLSEQIRK